MKVGLYANLSKPDAAATLKALATSARDLGVTLITSSKATARLAANCRTVAPARLGKSVDILLSLGGDGTVLQAVHALNGAKVPVLGINLGNLGFLTSVPDTAAMDALQAIASRAYQTVSYPLLEATLRSGAPQRKKNAPARALNDIVIGWGTSPRAAMIDVAVDGEWVASYVCDGLIVATPVGSTGHALSAGGPILHREIPAILLEPICPHTLSNRPLVLPNDRKITIRLPAQDKHLLL
ncbi:MAG: NAD(+)/NADH kinase, partial [Kiritimatiellia bacterium]